MTVQIQFNRDLSTQSLLLFAQQSGLQNIDSNHQSTTTTSNQNNQLKKTVHN